jgi:DNA replicative helicase MCM subunit Mcm2 (Cdc46/Mcm family)
MIDMLMDILKEETEGQGLDISDILERMGDNITGGDIKRAIGSLMERGEIYEPGKGHYMIVQ